MKSITAVKVFIGCLGLSFATSLTAATTYWVDSHGDVVRDGSGDCVIGLHGTAFPECGGEPVAQMESDSDGDGVPDSRDQCPNTPAGAKVDSRGCTVVSDKDGDGVPDSRDRCPATPANVTVNASGCPLDSDRDGVADYLDQCPGTSMGTTVDAKGCAEKIVVRNLNFALNSAELSAEARALLDNVAREIKGNPNVTQVTVTGHTDSLGDAAYNRALSERRARAVADYLGAQGLSDRNIKSVGMGEEKPIADNATATGRAQNRRVEIDLK
ncbi:MAG: OmpA family protein [Gammaproteobacteria bacterium]|nr:OmpA family protein [Gammaproteobacteria bacterium]MCW8957665.1 OmpA family protein [Gammaproteobacteria bacterium]MCW8971716.1 OmpA family protein [Gammaproteobacteria bacterium]MCW8993379.1 OmpA family protein [Gammaproteobacteria bacterium]